MTPASGTAPKEGGLARLTATAPFAPRPLKGTLPQVKARSYRRVQGHGASRFMPERDFMNEAETPDAEGGSAAADQQKLEALRWDWGAAYEIEMPGADHGWRARRLDGRGGWMDAGSAEDLRNQVVSDYVTKPVRSRSDPQHEQEG